MSKQGRICRCSAISLGFLRPIIFRDLTVEIIAHRKILLTENVTVLNCCFVSPYYQNADDKKRG